MTPNPPRPPPHLTHLEAAHQREAALRAEVAELREWDHCWQEIQQRDNARINELSAMVARLRVIEAAAIAVTAYYGDAAEPVVRQLRAALAAWKETPADE